MENKIIWCCEDDESIRDIEVYALNSVGFSARGFEDGASFWEALQKSLQNGENCKTEETLPSLVVLDIMLPKMSGTEILSKMKSSNRLSGIPIVMATAKGTEYDKIQGLDGGADYYLSKPFGVMELVSCVKAVLRRSPKKEKDDVISVKGIVINRNEHRVTVDGKNVNLTLKEYELLSCFLENIGTAFTREQLFNKIWGWDYVGTTRTLDIHINTLRGKIAPYGDLIQTVRGVGYKFSNSDSDSDK